MAKHPLEDKYGLSAAELLDAIGARFRLKVAVEGAVAEYHMEKHIRATDLRYETHDLDGQPDFSIQLPGRNMPLLAECKNVRESGKPGGDAYRVGGRIVAYKVETQKTRAAMGDPSSRYYGFEQYHILGVCLGKKTGDWSDFLFVRTIDLARHAAHSKKLAVMQRVPLPDVGELQSRFLEPPRMRHRRVRPQGGSFLWGRSLRCMRRRSWRSLVSWTIRDAGVGCGIRLRAWSC